MSVQSAAEDAPQTHSDWVIRAALLHRKILAPTGEKLPLSEYLASLPVAGSYELYVRSRKKQPARTATLEVRFGALELPLPTNKSPYIKALKPEPIAMNVVWVREVNAPKGTEPIEWVLYTSLDVKTFEDACTNCENDCKHLLMNYFLVL